VEAGPADGPAVVLVPGWACGAWVFRETLSGLAAAGFHTIAVELKGHGLSDKPESPDEYTLDSMGDHVVSILDGLGLRAAGLAGHSMGAAIAAHAAARVPDRVRGLALIAPVGFAGVRGMSLFRAITPRFAVPLLSRLATRFVVWVMLIIVYRLRRPTARDVDEFRAPTQFPNFVLALRHLLHRFDWKSEFPRVLSPRLVIVATRDHLSSWRDAKRYAGDGEPVVIRGAGHVILDEAPAEVNRVLADFFRAHAGEDYISTHDEQGPR
jgi:pimeloyl-ACP methyl ester carboxylesterase